MVRVEPFTFQMITAFKERLQLANKLNEVIDVLNTIEIDPEVIREIVETMLGDYYTKTEVDNIIASLPISNVYTKTEVDVLLDAIEDRLQVAEGDIDSLETDKANVSDVYTKTQVDSALSGKANTSDVYNKTQVDNLLTAKADASNVYTKSQVDTTVSRIDGDIAGKQDVLTAGTGITISNNVISATGGGGGGNLQLISASITPATPTSTTKRFYIDNLQQNDIVFVKGQVHVGTSGTFFSFSFIPNLDLSAVYSYKYPIEMGSSSSTGYSATCFISVADASVRAVYLDIHTPSSDGYYVSYEAYVLRSVV